MTDHSILYKSPPHFEDCLIIDDMVRHNYDATISNEALLNDGRVVEYDRCSKVTDDYDYGIRFDYIGTGIIYSVHGVKQIDRSVQCKPEQYRFYRMKPQFV